MPIFEPPTDEDVVFSDPYTRNPGNRLFRFVTPSLRGRNVYITVDGNVTENEPDNEDISKVFLGGHLNVITEDEKTTLTAAGYGSYITG